MIMSVFRPSRVKNGRRVRYRFYYGQYKLSLCAKVVRVPLHTTDRRVAEKRLRGIVEELQMEAAGLLATHTVRSSAQRSLSDHLDEYTMDLQKRGAAAMHVYIVERRVARLLEECGWTYPPEVSADSFVAWRSRQVVAPKTLNEYQDAVVGLLKWMRRQGRLSSVPLQDVAKVATRGREVRIRRALRDEELKRLLAVAPPTRARIYLMAAYTGLRRKELAQLTWSDVTLDGSRSQVRVRASTAKNRKEATLPLHADVVRALMAIRPGGEESHERLFASLPTMSTYRSDLKKAGIAYKDGQGRQADFHALRHTFGTNLARAGVQPRVAMELMRHSSMELTNRIYTDTSRLPTAAAIATLPGVSSSEP